MNSRVFGALVVLMVVPATCAFAQGLLPSRPVRAAMENVSLTPQQESELGNWLADMKKWRDFELRWGNTVSYGMNASPIKRPAKPNPPAWLTVYCQATVETAAEMQIRLKQGCALLADPWADVELLEASSQVNQKEKVVKTTFFTRMHLDFSGMQTAFGNGGPSLIGVIGFHVSLVDVGRVQFFGPPGVVLVLVPNGYGGREMKPGYTWGMSVRLLDFHFPRSGGNNRNATLFLNMTKCWVTGPSVAGIQVGGQDFVSLSISPKRN